MTIALRNLVYYARGNLAVLLGVAVGAAVLTGALFVGDSLKASLKTRAERQTCGVTAALVGERMLDDRLALPFRQDWVPALLLQGTISNSSGTATLRCNVIGLETSDYKLFDLQSEGTRLSPAAMSALGLEPGTRFRLNVQKNSIVPRSTLLGRRDLDELTTSITLTAREPLSGPAEHFSLQPGTTPINLFVSLHFLQEKLEPSPRQDYPVRFGRVNAFLSFGGDAAAENRKLQFAIEPRHWGLGIAVSKKRQDYVSVESKSLMLSPATAALVERRAKELNLRTEPTIVYLANWIAADETRRIPYSIVAAVNPNAAAPLGPFLPDGVKELKDDEIVLVDWPQSPLKDVPVGSPITLTYFEPEVEGRVVETSRTFKLVGRIPLAGVADDPDLTPPFPGITDKLKIGDWNPPFPFDNTRIKPGDVNEQFWEKYRTTPKAYITHAAGEKMFASRFGKYTSIRVAPGEGMTPQKTAGFLDIEIARKTDPQALGIQFEDIPARMAQASVGGTDFGGLFLGFSLFLIVAALVLIGLLVRLAVERRAKDIGSLLAIGFTPNEVRRTLFVEQVIVALFGIVIGLGLAVVYSRGLIAVLAALWPDDAVKAILQPHATGQSAAIAALGTLIMVMITIFFAVRGLVKLPIPQLLKGQTEAADSVVAMKRPRKSLLLIIILSMFGLAALFGGATQANPDFRAAGFFSGGGLILLAGILLVRRWLRSDHRPLMSTSRLVKVGMRNASRFPGRSTLTVILLAAATFLLVSVESFRPSSAQDFKEKSGGSGGFNLLVEVDVPVLQPFDRNPGLDDFLNQLEKEYQRQESVTPLADRMKAAETTLAKIKTLTPMRRRRGDDASCLNLYQAGKPRLIGVPTELIDGGGFRFSMTEAETPEEKANPWLLLVKPREDGAIPVIGEQNSVMYMLKKMVGDTIDLPDETGAMKKFRIVALLQDSVFQSELLTSDAAFQQRYPRDEGYSQFLLECDADTENDVISMLETGLRSHGGLVTRTADRVASYQAVVSTYLTTFQLLGGLGLLLGVLGLAAVVLRGVWERLGEFALLRAVGFSTANVRTLVMAEHLFLLVLGLGLGLVAAFISVAPHVALGGQWPWQGVALLILGTLVIGFIVIWLATRAALKVPIMSALRQE